MDQDDHHERTDRMIFAGVCWAIVLSALYVLSRHRFLLFHSVVEVASISVAFAIFMIVWNSRKFTQNGYMLFLGTAFLSVGVLDLIHTLAYKGMGVFPDHGVNLPTQLWIAARYLESLSFLVAPFFLRWRFNVAWVLLVYTILLCLVLLSIFSWGVFPACYSDVHGRLTSFKEISEFIIIGILLAALLVLFANRRAFDSRVLKWICCSITLTILSEFMFTRYTNPYEMTNAVGHLLKLVAFYCVYKALIEIGLREPYNLLYRGLKQREVDLQRARDDLETRVRRRTAELSQTVETLQEEVEARMRAERSYRESEKKYRTLVERIPAITHVVSLEETATLYISPQVEPILGFAPSAYADAPDLWAARLHPDDRHGVLTEMHRSRDPNTPFVLEYRMLARDNRTVWFRDEAVLVQDTGGRGLCVQGVMYEITEQKRMEQELAAQSKTLEAFFEYSITPLVILDDRFNFVSVNPAYAEFCRRDICEFEGRNYFELYPNPEYQQIFQETVQTKTPHQVSAKPFCFPDYPEWGVRYWDWTLVPILGDDGEVASLVFSIKDVTDAKKAEEKILADQVQLRALTSELLSVEDQERRAIAMELHDSVGQILAFIKIEMGELCRARLDPKLVQTVSHIREQVDAAIQQTRTLTFEISPPELYTLGLASGLEELTRRFSHDRQIECTIQDTDDLKPLSDQMKTLLYRSVRELLVNAAKHAKAGHVRVVVDRIDNDIQITVEDDGIGFDTSRLEDRSPHETEGFGLFSIRQRLTHMGGAMYIQSDCTKGTKVVLRAPLDNAGLQ